MGNKTDIPGMNLSLFEDPAPITPQKPKGYLVTIRQTKSGADIMVCTVHPPPAEAIEEAKAKGLSLFTGTEIQRMRQCPPEMVPYIMETKRVFPGSTIEQIINQMERA